VVFRIFTFFIGARSAGPRGLVSYCCSKCVGQREWTPSSAAVILTITALAPHKKPPRSFSFSPPLQTSPLSRIPCQIAVVCLRVRWISQSQFSQLIIIKSIRREIDRYRRIKSFIIDVSRFPSSGISNGKNWRNDWGEGKTALRTLEQFDVIEKAIRCGEKATDIDLWVCASFS